MATGICLLGSKLDGCAPLAAPALSPTPHPPPPPRDPTSLLSPGKGGVRPPTEVFAGLRSRGASARPGAGGSGAATLCAHSREGDADLCADSRSWLARLPGRAVADAFCSGGRAIAAAFCTTGCAPLGWRPLLERSPAVGDPVHSSCPFGKRKGLHTSIWALLGLSWVNGFCRLLPVLAKWTVLCE